MIRCRLLGHKYWDWDPWSMLGNRTKCKRYHDFCIRCGKYQ